MLSCTPPKLSTTTPRCVTALLILIAAVTLPFLSNSSFKWWRSNQVLTKRKRKQKYTTRLDAGVELSTGSYRDNTRYTNNNNERSSFPARQDNITSLRSPPNQPMAIVSSNSSAIRTTTTSTMPPNTRIYLIHVGKTGGLTLLNVLGRGATGHELQCRMERTSRGTLDDECLSEKRKKGTELQRHIIGRYHVGSPRFSKEQKKWLLNNTNMFLFTIRDPLDRVRSAFNFHKYSLQKKGGYYKNNKDRLFYARCFPDSVNHMLQVLRTNTTSVDCARLGHDALRGHMRGRGGGGNHFFYNYQKYRKYTLGSHPLDHAIAVIRTEHLWEDTIALDKELGGSGDFGEQEGRKETHGSETFDSNATLLTSANAAYLCCAIYREIEVYQELILKAVNLNVDEKHEDIMKLMAHCQINVPAENTVDFVSDPYSWSDFSNGDGCKIVQPV